MRRTSDNLYIEALLFGNSKLPEGVSFNDVIEYLRNNDFQIDKDLEKYFTIWYFNNFYCKTTYQTMKSGNFQQIYGLLYNSDLTTIKSSKNILTAEGYEVLQDYLKIEQAKKDSIKAISLSRWAIWISVASSIAQIIIQICVTK